MNGISAGTYIVYVDPSDPTLASQYYDGAYVAADATLLTLVAGETVTGIDFTLGLGRTISGTISPAPGSSGYFSVSATPVGGGVANYGNVNPDGTYELPGLAPAEYIVKADGVVAAGTMFQGFYKNTPFEEEATPVPVTGGDVAGIDVTMTGGVRIEGTISSVATPAPDDNSLVTVYRWENSSWSEVSSVSGWGYYLFGAVSGWAHYLAPGTYTVGFSDPGAPSGVDPADWEYPYCPQYHDEQPSLDLADEFTLASGETKNAVHGVLSAGCEAPDATAPGTFVSLDPSRLLDTRVGNGAPKAPVAANESVALQVRGRGGVPASDVAAVVLNVTVSEPKAGGFVTVYPSGTSMPTASNLNFSAGQNIPNLVTVKVGDDGKIRLANNSAGTAHLIADVAGYYLDGDPVVPGAFVSLDPSRLLDTREGDGAPKAPVAAYGTIPLKVTGIDQVPAVGVEAVVLNVTASQPTAGGFVTVYPAGTIMPTASNLNFSPGLNIPNLVTVKVGDGGKVNLTNNSAGTVQLIADVAGYYLAGQADEPGAFVSLDPSRLLDTRAGVGAPKAPVAADATVGLQVTGRGGVPVPPVAAVVVNVTVTEPATGGFVTVYPFGSSQPTASNLNFTGGQNIPNLVSVKVGTDGKINLRNNSAGNVHLIADVAGYFLSE